MRAELGAANQIQDWFPRHARAVLPSGVCHRAGVRGITEYGIEKEWFVDNLPSLPLAPEWLAANSTFYANANVITPNVALMDDA